mmetsp:Transcript_25873/g.76779  ORF Transcript_25873/g.76779 Transcript_25873/m.76779 type:complete len:288 (-) Transcript_25873:944-1807(-)
MHAANRRAASSFERRRTLPRSPPPPRPQASACCGALGAAARCRTYRPAGGPCRLHSTSTSWQSCAYEIVPSAAATADASLATLCAPVVPPPLPVTRGSSSRSSSRERRPSASASYISTRYSSSALATRSLSLGGSTRQRSRLHTDRARCVAGRSSERMRPRTVCTGDISARSSSSTLAICAAAAVAAAASTSQRALEMEAAAATMAPTPGKATHVRHCRTGEGRNGSTSTTATVVAAQSPERADVNGRMAPARAPWLAYVSEIAAQRDLSATASTPRARVYSTLARE